MAVLAPPRLRRPLPAPAPPPSPPPLPPPCPASLVPPLQLDARLGPAPSPASPSLDLGHASAFSHPPPPCSVSVHPALSGAHASLCHHDRLPPGPHLSFPALPTPLQPSPRPSSPSQLARLPCSNQPPLSLMAHNEPHASTFHGLPSSPSESHSSLPARLANSSLDHSPPVLAPGSDLSPWDSGDLPHGSHYGSRRGSVESMSNVARTTTHSARLRSGSGDSLNHGARIMAKHSSAEFLTALPHQVSSQSPLESLFQEVGQDERMAISSGTQSAVLSEVAEGPELQSQLVLENQSWLSQGSRVDPCVKSRALLECDSSSGSMSPIQESFSQVELCETPGKACLGKSANVIQRHSHLGRVGGDGNSSWHREVSECDWQADPEKYAHANLSIPPIHKGTPSWQIRSEASQDLSQVAAPFSDTLGSEPSLKLPYPPPLDHLHRSFRTLSKAEWSTGSKPQTPHRLLESDGYEPQATVFPTRIPPASSVTDHPDRSRDLGTEANHRATPSYPVPTFVRGVAELNKHSSPPATVEPAHTSDLTTVAPKDQSPTVQEGLGSQSPRHHQGATRESESIFGHSATPHMDYSSASLLPAGQRHQSQQTRTFLPHGHPSEKNLASPPSSDSDSDAASVVASQDSSSWTYRGPAVQTTGELTRNTFSLVGLAECREEGISSASVHGAVILPTGRGAGVAQPPDSRQDGVPFDIATQASEPLKDLADPSSNVPDGVISSSCKVGSFADNNTRVIDTFEKLRNLNTCPVVDFSEPVVQRIGDFTSSSAAQEAHLVSATHNTDPTLAQAFGNNCPKSALSGTLQSNNLILGNLEVVQAREKGQPKSKEHIEGSPPHLAVLVAPVSIPAPLASAQVVKAVSAGVSILGAPPPQSMMSTTGQPWSSDATAMVVAAEADAVVSNPPLLSDDLMEAGNPLTTFKPSSADEPLFEDLDFAAPHPAGAPIPVATVDDCTVLPVALTAAESLPTSSEDLKLAPFVHETPACWTFSRQVLTLHPVASYSQNNPMALDSPVVSEDEPEAEKQLNLREVVNPPALQDEVPSPSQPDLVEPRGIANAQTPGASASASPHALSFTGLEAGAISTSEPSIPDLSEIPNDQTLAQRPLTSTEDLSVTSLPARLNPPPDEKPLISYEAIKQVTQSVEAVVAGPSAISDGQTGTEVPFTRDRSASFRALHGEAAPPFQRITVEPPATGCNQTCAAPQTRALEPATTLLEDASAAFAPALHLGAKQTSREASVTSNENSKPGALVTEPFADSIIAQTSLTSDDGMNVHLAEAVVSHPSLRSYEQARPQNSFTSGGTASSSALLGEPGSATEAITADNPVMTDDQTRAELHPEASNWAPHRVEAVATSVASNPQQSTEEQTTAEAPLTYGRNLNPCPPATEASADPARAKKFLTLHEAVKTVVSNPPAISDQGNRAPKPSTPVVKPLLEAEHSLTPVDDAASASAAPRPPPISEKQTPGEASLTSTGSSTPNATPIEASADLPPAEVFSALGEAANVYLAEVMVLGPPACPDSQNPAEEPPTLDGPAYSPVRQKAAASAATRITVVASDQRSMADDQMALAGLPDSLDSAAPQVEAASAADADGPPLLAPERTTQVEETLFSLADSSLGAPATEASAGPSVAEELMVSEGALVSYPPGSSGTQSPANAPLIISSRAASPPAPQEKDATAAQVVAADKRVVGEEQHVEQPLPEGLGSVVSHVEADPAAVPPGPLLILDDQTPTEKSLTLDKPNAIVVLDTADSVDLALVEVLTSSEEAVVCDLQAIPNGQIQGEESLPSDELAISLTPITRTMIAEERVMDDDQNLALEPLPLASALPASHLEAVTPTAAVDSHAAVISNKPGSVEISPAFTEDVKAHHTLPDKRVASLPLAEESFKPDEAIQMAAPQTVVVVSYTPVTFRTDETTSDRVKTHEAAPPPGDPHFVQVASPAVAPALPTIVDEQTPAEATPTSIEVSDLGAPAIEPSAEPPPAGGDSSACDEAMIFSSAKNVVSDPALTLDCQTQVEEPVTCDIRATPSSALWEEATPPTLQMVAADEQQLDDQAPSDPLPEASDSLASNVEALPAAVVLSSPLISDGQTPATASRNSIEDSDRVALATRDSISLTSAQELLASHEALLSEPPPTPEDQTQVEEPLTPDGQTSSTILHGEAGPITWAVVADPMDLAEEQSSQEPSPEIESSLAPEVEAVSAAVGPGSPTIEDQSATAEASQTSFRDFNPDVPVTQASADPALAEEPMASVITTNVPLAEAPVSDPLAISDDQIQAAEPLTSHEQVASPTRPEEASPPLEAVAAGEQSPEESLLETSDSAPRPPLTQNGQTPLEATVGLPEGLNTPGAPLTQASAEPASTEEPVASEEAVVSEALADSKVHHQAEELMVLDGTLCSPALQEESTIAPRAIVDDKPVMADEQSPEESWTSPEAVESVAPRAEVAPASASVVPDPPIVAQDMKSSVAFPTQYFSSLPSLLPSPSPSLLSVPFPEVDPATLAKVNPTPPIVSNISREVILPAVMKKISTISTTSTVACVTDLPAPTSPQSCQVLPTEVAKPLQETLLLHAEEPPLTTCQAMAMVGVSKGQPPQLPIPTKKLHLKSTIPKKSKVPDVSRPSRYSLSPTPPQMKASQSYKAQSTSSRARLLFTGGFTHPTARSPRQPPHFQLITPMAKVTTQCSADPSSEPHPESATTCMEDDTFTVVDTDRVGADMPMSLSDPFCNPTLSRRLSVSVKELIHKHQNSTNGFTRARTSGHITTTENHVDVDGALDNTPTNSAQHHNEVSPSNVGHSDTSPVCLSVPVVKKYKVKKANYIKNKVATVAGSFAGRSWASVFSPF